MKILFVYEHFFPPFDEGVKNFAEMIHEQLTVRGEVKLVRYARFLPNIINSLIILPRLILSGFFFRPDCLIFIPQGSLTFSSFLKIFILQMFFGKKLTTVGTQKRTLAPWQKQIVNRMKVSSMYVLSASMRRDLEELGISAGILNAGIDRERYKPIEDKIPLRRKYRIDPEKLVVLHVGHIRESRNISWLLEIASASSQLQVVLVGSTSTERENGLCQQLDEAGIIVFKDYLDDIHEIYQLTDIYCFPVMVEDAAMEIPLSVLEAMATNLPVLTTEFGRLPEQFSEDAGYRYVGSPLEIIELINHGFGADCNNRKKIESYTWKATAERLTMDRSS
jgi:glycosyltransferase involved in cell wall biosynthesis